MSATSETPVAERQILIVGPYGVLGTGVVDAVAENPRWGITTAARRPAPTYRTQAAPPHISVVLMDREGTTKSGCLWMHTIATRSTPSTLTATRITRSTNSGRSRLLRPSADESNCEGK
jgi:hypothetical protein